MQPDMEPPLIPREEGVPPGRIKIMNALTVLLQEKEFNRVTTAEIARAAGVTEGLIYKYFKDKQDLLYQVLRVLFQVVIDDIEQQLSPADYPSEKLRTFVRASIASYEKSRVFSKIILLEVRNSPKFYESEAYQLVRRYSGLLWNILQEGVDSGEFAPDIEIRSLREIIIGTIEHSCLSSIIFDRDIDVDHVTDQLCRTLFHGISSPPTPPKDSIQ